MMSFLETLKNFDSSTMVVLKETNKELEHLDSGINNFKDSIEASRNRFIDEKPLREILQAIDRCKRFKNLAKSINNIKILSEIEKEHIIEQNKTIHLKEDEHFIRETTKKIFGSETANLEFGDIKRHIEQYQNTNKCLSEKKLEHQALEREKQLEEKPPIANEEGSGCRGFIILVIIITIALMALIF